MSRRSRFDRPEQLGTKPKQWLRDGDDRWLFKWLSDEPGRRHRGEDWAERVVGEIGVALGVQCAYVELAHRGESRGIISRDVADDYDLVHGNELLAGDLADYPRYELRRIAAYQIINVVQVLCRLESSPLTGRPAVFADARTLTDAVSRILEIAPEAMQSWVTRLDSIGVDRTSR